MKLFGFVSLVICSFLFSSPLFAATDKMFSLQMELSIDGKLISSPSVVTADGELASVTQETPNGRTHIEVVTTEGTVGKRKGIMMRFAVSAVDASGKKTYLGRPQIFAYENQPANITVTDDERTLSLSVIAQKQTL